MCKPTQRQNRLSIFQHFLGGSLRIPQNDSFNLILKVTNAWINAWSHFVNKMLFSFLKATITAATCRCKLAMLVTQLAKSQRTGESWSWHRPLRCFGPPEGSRSRMEESPGSSILFPCGEECWLMKHQLAMQLFSFVGGEGWVGTKFYIMLLY